MSSTTERPLLQAWPSLASATHYEPLCSLPTPVTCLDAMGQTLGLSQLYAKRDDLSASPYGGNKTRKLEFLLGEAKQKGHEEVLTFGYAGSNFALATALYAQRLGMRCISMLLPQENAPYVRQNLLLGHQHGAELHTASTTWQLGAKTLWQTLRHGCIHKRLPYWIPAGGSHPLGILGFVNAAYELHEQIEQGLCPAPDVIYLPLGSMGTAIGLDIGFRALGLRPRIIATRVVPTQFGSQHLLEKLSRSTLKFLRSIESDFPLLRASETLCEVRDEFFGDGYGVQTEASIDAANLARENAGLELDGTYAAKAMACLVSDARSRKLEGRNVLFWCTGNSHEITEDVNHMSHQQLPKAFHSYFKNSEAG